jgi:hypothetical protein
MGISRSTVDESLQAQVARSIAHSQVPPFANRLLGGVPNELWDAAFINMSKHELLDLSLTCKQFQNSAQKALFSKITITTTREGKVKKFCSLLKTILTSATLANYVKHLDVAFIRDPDSKSATEHSCHVIVAPDWPLFAARLQDLESRFNIYNEKRNSITYNTLLALMLSGLPQLTTLQIDYTGFNGWFHRHHFDGIDFNAALLDNIIQGLQQLQYVSISNLEGVHKMQAFNLARSLIALPSLLTLNVTSFLPLLPVTYPSTVFTSLEVSPSRIIMEFESFKLTDLLKVSPNINHISITLPINSHLPGNAEYSTILTPIALNLKSLDLKYDTTVDSRNWDIRRDWPRWPRFLALYNFPVLKTVNVSWHFFFNRIKGTTPEIINHLPSSLEKLSIHDVPIEFTVENSLAHAQQQFLRQLRMLGDAVGVGHLGGLRELTLEIYSSKKVKVEVCLDHLDI